HHRRTGGARRADCGEICHAGAGPARGYGTGGYAASGQSAASRRDSWRVFRRCRGAGGSRFAARGTWFGWRRFAARSGCGLRRGGLQTVRHRLGVSGFITRTVADAAFLHDITPRPAPARIGVLKQPLFAHTRIDPRHLRAVDEAAAQLSAAGYPVEEIKPYPTADVTFEAFRHIFTSRLAGMDAGEGYFEWVRQQGLKVSKRMLADALRHASGLPRLLSDCWQVDAILTPMLAYTPPPIGTFLALDHEENFM